MLAKLIFTQNFLVESAAPRQATDLFRRRLCLYIAFIIAFTPGDFLAFRMLLVFFVHYIML